MQCGTIVRFCEEQEKRSFVPYRDSKCTRLLASALGGGGMLIAIVHARDDR